MDYDFSKDLGFDRSKYIDEIIDEERRQIVVLEVRILSRKEALATLPKDDPQSAIEKERSEAEMDQFKELIQNKVLNISMLEKLAKK